jgi:hypothetical protein
MCWKVKMPKVATSARDLVASTESAAPDAPVMGDIEDTYGSGKKTGKESLKITKASSSGSSTLDTDSIYF